MAMGEKRKSWMLEHDKVLRDAILAAQDADGGVPTANWPTIAKIVSENTGVERSTAAVIHRAYRLGIIGPGEPMTRRRSVKPGRRWMKAHDRVLKRVLSESMDEDRKIPKEAWPKITEIVSEETGVPRTVQAVQFRATKKRYYRVRPYNQKASTIYRQELADPPPNPYVQPEPESETEEPTQPEPEPPQQEPAQKRRPVDSSNMLLGGLLQLVDDRIEAAQKNKNNNSNYENLIPMIQKIVSDEIDRRFREMAGQK
jgi:hypothetical protein